MIQYCPNCDSESELVLKERQEEFDVRGEKIPVKVQFLVCQKCGEELEDPEAAPDPVEAVFVEYRRRKGMVTPKEIRAFRERYGLTQQELSDLLGFGGATLSRYENGALQTESNDRMLRLMMEPGNLLKIIKANSSVLESEKSNRLISTLKAETTDAVYSGLLEAGGYNAAPSEINGYQKLNLSKVLAAVGVLCPPGGIYKTKLNKLLYYSDNLHFRDFGKSITGLSYAHLPFGPCPEKFEVLYEMLTQRDARFVQHEELIQDTICVSYTFEDKPDLALLLKSEYEVLRYVAEHFSKISAAQIANLSHREKGYQETQNGEPISYRFAQYLDI